MTLSADTKNVQVGSLVRVIDDRGITREGVVRAMAERPGIEIFGRGVVWVPYDNIVFVHGTGPIVR